MTNLKKTPLYSFHRENGARFVVFGGWEMPVQYTSILEEATAVRNAVGFFDVSHMGEARVTGPGAQAYLNYVMSNDFSSLESGKALYTVMCYENGGCVDDLIVYKIADDDYFLCINAGNKDKDITWLQEHVKGFDCTVEDVSDQYGQIAIQGPRAKALMAEIIADAADLKPFTFAQVEIAGTQVILSATGYTGEPGYEIYSPWDKTPDIAAILMNAGKPLGIKLAGLGARDILRLEAGYSLYGHELNDGISPLEAGVGFVVKLKKEADFIGKQALLNQKEQGVKQRVVFFKLEGRRIARQTTKIYFKDDCVGEVVSGGMSVMLNQPIGSALIDAKFVEEELIADIRGTRVPIIKVKPPFYKKEVKNS